MENLFPSCYVFEKMKEADDEVKTEDTTPFIYLMLSLS